MTICVAGWYFTPAFVETLRASKHPCFWVCHKTSPSPLGMPHKTIRNIGLEFGCYSWWLDNEWKGGPVLFVHDDVRLSEGDLNRIADLSCDQAFLFSSKAEAEANGRAHGRAIWCSEKMLSWIKGNGGIWFNESLSTGAPIPATTADAPDFHNTGIKIFKAMVVSTPGTLSTNKVIIMPQAKFGYRGVL